MASASGHFYLLPAGFPAIVALVFFAPVSLGGLHETGTSLDFDRSPA